MEEKNKSYFSLVIVWSMQKKRGAKNIFLFGFKFTLNAAGKIIEEHHGRKMLNKKG
jgi:hypothetical protein